jgi:hypothetical protein
MKSLKHIEERKIVPLVAMISAGKSHLLNVLYNIDFLECKAGIGTKFVNIIRYNPEIKEPRFYHLLLEKKGDKYIFYKDISKREIVGNREIIEENKRINKMLAEEKDVVYENIFYMTEINESPFITDKQYLLTHDLCDIPGLSEYQEKPKDPLIKIPIDNNASLDSLVSALGIDIKKPGYKENEENETDDDEKELEEPKNFGFENNDLKKKEQKTEDDIYYNVHLQNNTYINEIFSIIKDYIDGGIIILSSEKYYFKENFEMIAMLSKVIGKTIDNFLIILNKIDLSENPEEDIEKCKGLFMKYFPSCKTFNLNKNTFIPLSTNQLKNELLLKKSFDHLLNYHFNNYLAKVKNEQKKGKSMEKSFIDHLRDIIKTVEGITKEGIINKIKESIIISDNEIIKIINEIKDKFKGEEIKYGISEHDFKKELFDDDDDDDDDDNVNRFDFIEKMNASYIVKLIYIYQKENKLIPDLSETSKELFNYFKFNKTGNQSTIVIIPKEKDKIDINKINIAKTFQTKINKRIINELKKVTKEIKNSEFIGNEIKNIMRELYLTMYYLKIYDVIFIPFLGPSNAGKSTIINNIIGEDVLQTSSNECTKKGIIIRYKDDNEPDFTIRKANFKNSEFLGEKNYYFEPEEKPIATGLQNVKNTIKSLNYEFTDKEEDSFYYVKTKIKLFDDLGFDDSLKKMIYLIDFPGFGTANIFEKGLYQKVMSICNAFIFVVRNSVIKEKMNKNYLDDLFTQTMRNKKKLSSGLIKSCLFIFNNDESQQTTKKDLEIAKKDIKSLIKRIPDTDINACFFNAKYYQNYQNNYNYFFNIRRTIKNINKKYKNLRADILINPENFIYKKKQKFEVYLNKTLEDKINDIGLGAPLNKKSDIDENILEEVKTTISKLEFLNSISDNKIKNIAMNFTYARQNINNLQTLKESNINEFKKAFLSQINIINDEIQTDVKEKTDKIIETLDYFFSAKFSERKKDLQSFEEFKKNILFNVLKLKKLRDSSKKEIEVLRKNYYDNIKKLLEEKKDNIKIALKSKVWTKLQEEIFEEIKSKAKELSEKINNHLNKIDSLSTELYLDAKKYIYYFTEGKMKLTNLKTFKVFFSERVSNKDMNISDEINKEIKLCSEQGFSKIWGEKSFWDFIGSIVFRSSYLTNILEIIIAFCDKQIRYILYLLSENFYKYMNSMKYLVKSRFEIISLRYTKIQEKEWEKLCKMYQESRKSINRDLEEIHEIKHL